MIERPDRFTFNSKGLQDHLVIQQFYGTDSEHEENVRPRVMYHVLHAVTKQANWSKIWTTVSFSTYTVAICLIPY